MQTALLTTESIKQLVSQACRKVEKVDALLWEYNVCERAFAHRLAVYIEESFPGYHVDCEYNKQGTNGEAKNTSYTINGIYADVIVHTRGDNKHNILHAELKRSDNHQGATDDLKRLVDSKKPPKSYDCSCLIIINITARKLEVQFV